MRIRPLIGLFALLLLFTFLAGVSKQNQVHASPLQQEYCFSQYDWRELKMGSFVIIFPAEYIGLAHLIKSSPYDLDSLVANYGQAFGKNLPLPITLRIYPAAEDFYCLNPQAPFFGSDLSHANVGLREIALFVSSFQVHTDQWQSAIFNGIKHELAALFAKELTGGYAPPGLLFGIGGYAENPEDTFLDRFEGSGSPVEADLSWKVLWDETAPWSNQRSLLQATSTVAYLIDSHGWEKFIELLEEINLQQGYRQALVDVYGENLPAIENHWQTYFPVYVNQRWQTNVFHNYDLSYLQQLLSAGAYRDSVSRLEQAISHISIFGSAQELETAKDLLNRAEIGAEAGDLAQQARQALFSGRFEESYSSAILALEKYDSLGDTRRTTELLAYQAAAKEVLDLRAGLEVIRGEGVGFNPFKSQEVYAIGLRLLALGDQEGVAQVSTILSVLGIEQNTFFQFLISLVILVSTGLIVRRMISTRRNIPPEADLI
jgi:hypothetical protein